VKSWKDNNAMQLPNFDPKRIEELKGTITYPPEGSAVKEDKK
jgi:MscS family membrane protein